MTPITHFVYVAAAVFMLGLFGVVRGRNLRVTLMSIQLMVAACVLVLVAYARWWGNHDGQVMGIVVAVVSTASYFVGLLIRRAATASAAEQDEAS
jgi:NADH-quinone oxidoreductase subunit K